MVDRVRIGNGRSSKLKCPADYAPADFAAFLADLKNGVVYVDLTPNNSEGSDAGVTVIGTPLNKANLLSDTTATGLGFGASDNPSVNDAFGVLAKELKVTSGIAFPASGWSNAAPYTQAVSVTGITEDTNVVYDLDLDTDSPSLAVQSAMVDAFSFVNELTTGNGTITLTCVQSKPTADFKIKIKGA